MPIYRNESSFVLLSVFLLMLGPPSENGLSGDLTALFCGKLSCTDFTPLRTSKLAEGHRMGILFLRHSHSHLKWEWKKDQDPKTT